MPSNNAKYTQEFREETARYVIESGKSSTSVAEEIGIDKNTVCSWVRAYRRKNGMPSYAEERGIQDPVPSDSDLQPGTFCEEDVQRVGAAGSKLLPLEKAKKTKREKRRKRTGACSENPAGVSEEQAALRIPENTEKSGKAGSFAERIQDTGHHAEDRALSGKHEEIPVRTESLGKDPVFPERAETGFQGGSSGTSSRR